MVLNLGYIQEQMKLGVKAHKEGDHLAARLNFQAVLREDPRNIPALLWLAYLATDSEKQIFLLNRVLEIDPDNERAKKGLQWVKQQKIHPPKASPKPAVTQASQESESRSLPEQDEPQAETTTAETTPTDEPGISLETLKKRLGTDDLKEQAKKGTIAQRARRRINPPLAILIAGAVLLSLIAWRLLSFQEPVSLADLAPSATPTFTLEPSATPTPYPSATFTNTPTHTPAPPTPTATMVAPTATPAPPTPTPLPLAYQPAHPGEKWIEVNLSEQTVTAWEGEESVMSFLTSTGLSNTPTVVGQFRIYQKLVSTRMAGPGYDLPNVPYTMYFHGGYALHGAYWHNNFGQPMSHGCVNLSPTDAEKLFKWADPLLPEGTSYINTTADNPGTLVVVHQ